MRTPSSILDRLGFSRGDRVLVVHADDVGMCEATVSAFAELVEHGSVSSGSVMVPCPWFLAAAELCRERPDLPGLDMGVHLTLTSEWRTYRWGPIAARDPASGLVDEEGFFHRRREAVERLADPAAAAFEMRAQVDRALAAGIDVTHVDSHMFSAFSPALLPAYLDLGRERRIPPLLFRPAASTLRFLTEPGILSESRLRGWEEEGLPVFDHLAVMLLHQPDDRLDQVKQVLAGLPPGLSLLILHPAADTPELRRITPDWRARVADYATLRDLRLQRCLADLGFQVIGYRALREAAFA